MKKKKTPIPQEIQVHNINLDLPVGNSPKKNLTYPKRRVRIGLVFTFIGYLMFLLGARPSLVNLDQSRVIGFIQISVFLLGLGIIALGSYLTLNAFWPNGKRTIVADIGTRIISTGYVICIFTAMADIFGMGSHPLPDVFFGPLQAQGMMIGMGIIAIGILMMIRYKRPELKSLKWENKPQEGKKKGATVAQNDPMETYIEV